MSYILDALNKSEQERKSSKTPDLNTVHRRPGSVEPTKSKAWIIILVVILVVNCLGLWLWLGQSSSTQPELPATARQTPTPGSPAPAAPQPASGPVTQPNYQQANVSPQPQANSNTTVQYRPQTTSTNTSTSEGVLITPNDVPAPAPRILRISELPVNVQRQVPDLKFSSHLFASDPGLRMVNINGKMIREGDTIKDGFRLVEITEEGVVISYLHYQFEVSVLRDWSFN